MHISQFKFTFLLIVISTIIFPTKAQKVNEPKAVNEEWSKPYPPFRIAGNLYYVGTYDLACYLITTPKGNILINTGLASSESQIKRNIQTLGFKFADIKILLNTQAHFDHTGALAAIKKQTKAKLMLNEKDAQAMKDGGDSDYALGGNGMSFMPVKADRLLKNGDSISLGGMNLIMLHHPGHTKGSSSFLFSVKDGSQFYKILIANMPSIVTEKPFSEIVSYPEIANDYAYTIKAMENIQFDLWLSSHASQFDLHTKHKSGDPYNPATFKDQKGYDDNLNGLEKQFEDKMKQ
jgi:metallo-beta-lactamase class B